MVIINSIEKKQYCKNSVLTIGSLDGLHKGHAHILSSLKELSLSKNIPSIVITFDPHPRMILSEGDSSFKSLISAENKIKFLKELKIDYVWMLPFSKEFSLITADIFLNEYIVKFFNPRDIIIGYDHHFGNNKQGSKKFLIENSKKYNYNLHTKEVVLYDNIPISSSRIRNLLSKGNINDANECLGYNYEINGVVIKGNGVGKEIGFPTINIQPYMCNQLIPAQGVYCVDVKIEKKIYTGMCNIGIRPTFYKYGEQSIEVHLLTDDIVDYYDEKVSVSFKSYLRKERKYKSKDKLIEQLLIDREVCFNI